MSQSRASLSTLPPMEKPNNPSLLADFLTELSTRSKLDEFRLFFDFKHDSWKLFRDQLHEHVQSSTTWPEVQTDAKPWTKLQTDAKERRKCAEAFLEQFGEKYWGKDNRRKHLLAERLERRDVCKYPEEKEAMADALVLLLEKSAKNRRESATLDVSGTRAETSHALENVTTTAVTGASGASTVTSSPTMKTSTSPEVARVLANTQVHDLLASMSGTGEDHARRPAARDLSRGQAGRTQNGRVSFPEIQEAPGQRTTPGQNMLASYFLVTASEDHHREAVCIPFNFFETTDEFLDAMEEGLSLPGGDDSSMQLYNEMSTLRRRYAVVHLKWSGVCFVIRRGTDDLQALVNRVRCAWAAKDRGELELFEFKIGVTLKMA